MNVLFSIHPVHLDRIFSRKKTVELRNRAVRVKPNSWMWLYATTPRKRLEGRALIRKVIIDTPENIWRKFKAKLGLSRKEFFVYAGASSRVSAILLSKIEQFSSPLHLEVIRDYVINFHPPQFYVLLPAGVHQVLTKRIESAK